jgi:hypothetical protein
LKENEFIVMNLYEWDFNDIIKIHIMVKLWLIQTGEVSWASSSMVRMTYWDGEAGRCLTPYLFNLWKLIDKFQNLLL